VRRTKRHPVIPSSWPPDWKCSKQYPGPGTTRRQWKWEFLRRNPGYQADYARLMAQPYYQWLQRQANKTVIDEPEPPSPNLGMNTIALKYGLNGMVFDPANNAPYGITFEADPCNPSMTEFVMIHLSRPIEPQLERVKSIWTQYRQVLKIRPKRHTPRIGDFQNYLRILDARTCGASFKEIGAAIYPNIPNVYPEYSASDRVKKTYAAAKRVRDIDYLLI
jgi:hypothetical protein